MLMMQITEVELCVYSFILYIAVVSGMIIFKGYQQQRWQYWKYSPFVEGEDFFIMVFWPFILFYKVTISLPYKFLIRIGKQLYVMRYPPLEDEDKNVNS